MKLEIDLPDPTGTAVRQQSGLSHAQQPESVPALQRTTPARIGVGRAGSRPRTGTLLLFQADHAVTQDALLREVDPDFLQAWHLFTVESQARDRQEYLKRPDLGRKLTTEARWVLGERCVPEPDVQIFVGDGLSATAVEHNIPHLLPVLQHGLQAAGLTMGTPFFVRNARVGLLNEVNAIVKAKVCAVLIGERPGLARAESLSIYAGYNPQPDHTDAQRNAICNIYQEGLNPLEAGAVAVQLFQKMLARQTSGVELTLPS